MFQHFLKQARHNSLFQAQMHIHINAIFYAYGLNSFVYVLVKLFVIDDKLVNELIRYNIAQSIDAQKSFHFQTKWTVSANSGKQSRVDYDSIEAKGFRQICNFYGTRMISRRCFSMVQYLLV